MILLPAIDILEGKAVRLTQGEFDQSTVYDADPLDAARRWVNDGARRLHSLHVITVAAQGVSRVVAFQDVAALRHFDLPTRKETQ